MSKKHQQNAQKPAQKPQEKPAAEKAPDDHATQAKLHGELAKLAGEPLDPGAAQRLQAAHAEAQKGAGMEMMKAEPIGTPRDEPLMMEAPPGVEYAPQGSPAGDPSKRGDEPLEKQISDKAFEAGVWEGVASGLSAQLEELLERLRAMARPGEAPASVLDRLVHNASVIEKIMVTEHPHAALVSLVQTDAKPERYTLRLMEKTHTGEIASSTLCKSKSWAECRDVMARIVSTRVVPEPFRE